MFVKLLKAFNFCLFYLNAINIFTTDVNTCSTDKKFKKEQNDFNKTQVTEKALVKIQSESKFLFLTPKLNKLSIKINTF